MFRPSKISQRFIGYVFMRKRWGNCSTIFITLVVWDSIKDWPKWLSVKKHEKNCNRWFVFNHWKAKWMLSVSCESFSCQSFACSCSAHIAKVIKVVTVIFVYFLYNIVTLSSADIALRWKCLFLLWMSEWVTEWVVSLHSQTASTTHTSDRKFNDRSSCPHQMIQ